MRLSRPVGVALLAVLFAAAAAGVYLIRLPAPWPAQDPAYHDFADARAMLGVPNMLNVASNLPFLLVGLFGLAMVARYVVVDRWERWAAFVFFGGVALTCFGSSYDHWAPANATLFWDRMPMTFGFMALFAMVIGERLYPALGRALFVPFVVAGLASVVYWHLTEQAGHGDLRPYVLVQFFPLASIPLLLALLPPRYTHTADYFVVIGWYVLAKVLEVLDRPIFETTGHLVSGHSLKHVSAAVATWWLLLMLRRRRPIDG